MCNSIFAIIQLDQLRASEDDKAPPGDSKRTSAVLGRQPEGERRPQGVSSHSGEKS